MHRKLKLAEMMLLVAATAPGLLLLRAAAGMGLFQADPRASPGRNWVEYMSVAAGCILMPLAAAVIVLNFGKRHAGQRDFVGRPGFVACATTLAASIVPVSRFVVRMVTSTDRSQGDFIVGFNNLLASICYDAALMTIGAWVGLLLVGCWKPRPDWLDRLGRGIGAGWICVYAYTQLYFILRPLLA